MSNGRIFRLINSNDVWVKVDAIMNVIPNISYTLPDKNIRNKIMKMNMDMYGDTELLVRNLIRYIDLLYDINKIKKPDESDNIIKVYISSSEEWPEFSETIIDADGKEYEVYNDMAGFIPYRLLKGHKEGDIIKVNTPGFIASTDGEYSDVTMISMHLTLKQSDVYSFEPFENILERAKERTAYIDGERFIY